MKVSANSPAIYLYPFLRIRISYAVHAILLTSIKRYKYTQRWNLFWFYQGTFFNNLSRHFQKKIIAFSKKQKHRRVIITRRLHCATLDWFPMLYMRSLQVLRCPRIYSRCSSWCQGIFKLFSGGKRTKYTIGISDEWCLQVNLGREDTGWIYITKLWKIMIYGVLSKDSQSGARINFF